MMCFLPGLLREPFRFFWCMSCQLYQQDMHQKNYCERRRREFAGHLQTLIQLVVPYLRDCFYKHMSYEENDWLRSHSWAYRLPSIYPDQGLVESILPIVSPTARRNNAHFCYSCQYVLPIIINSYQWTSLSGINLCCSMLQ